MTYKRSRTIALACLLTMCLPALALAQVCPTQWDFYSSGTVNTNCPRIDFGMAGEAAKLLADPSAVHMTISNRTDGALTLDYSTALSFRQGKGGGPIKFWMDGNGQLGLGTTAPLALLDVRGTTRTTVLEITGGSDLAERFDVTGDFAAEPGTVLSIDATNPGRLRVASGAYDRAVVGVVSGARGIAPGMQMGQAGTLADGKVPVAVTGRVFVAADTSNGAILPGDLLTTSTRAGSVMKATDPARMIGAIVGKALTPLSDEDGMVLMVVALQ